MRKKSISEIQKKYKLSAEDKKSIASTVTAIGLKDSVKMMQDSAKSMEKVTDALQKSNDKQIGNIEKLLSNHVVVVKEILKRAGDMKKEWEFDVRRNKSGFISKVLAKQIK
jgi:hypothetical protein